MVTRTRNGVVMKVSVPVSYPEAPGRIVRREAPRPMTRPGAARWQVARGNVGVRWRHPGIHRADVPELRDHRHRPGRGVQVDRLYLCDEAPSSAWWDCEHVPDQAEGRHRGPGLRATIQDSAYPSHDFHDLYVSIEYPLKKQTFPGVWVQYDDNDSLRIAGLDHKEFVLDDLNQPHEVTRWEFAGTVTLTCVALTSLERDNLFDEMVRIYAFSRIEHNPTPFRDIIENNDFIAVVVNWDQLRPNSDAAGPGTPWGTDDIVYEKSLSFDVEGEFVSDPGTQALLILSSIVTIGSYAGNPETGPISSWKGWPWMRTARADRLRPHGLSLSPASALGPDTKI